MGKILFWLYFSTCAADAGVTHHAFDLAEHTTGVKVSEVNPILPDNKWVIDVAQVGLGTAGGWSVKELWKSGRKKTAIGFVVGNAAFRGWIIKRNLNEMKKIRNQW